MRTEPVIRSRRPSSGRVACVLAALALAVAGCGTPTAMKTIAASPKVRGNAPDSAQPVTPAAVATPAGQASTAAGQQPACSIPAIEAIGSESSSADAQRTASWVILQANDWTVLVPSNQWTMSASTAGGADIFSPDGDSSANLGDKESQTPWTLTTLSQLALSSVSNLRTVCTQRSGTLQVTEFIGDYQQMVIHGIAVVGLVPSSVPDFFAGSDRTIYSPASLWSTAVAQTLWLIVKHAVFVPPTQQ